MEFKKEQIEQLKQQHGVVFEYKTKDGKKAIFRKPTFVDLEIASNAGKTFLFDQKLATECFVAGDKEIVHDDKYMLGLRDWLGVIIDKVDGELGEL